MAFGNPLLGPPKRRSIGSLVATLFLSTFALAFTHASHGSSALDRQVQFQIPAQTLEGALIDFAHQAGVSVFVAAKALGDARAPSVVGTLKAVDALTRLLADTGLSYSTEGDTITVGPNSTTASDFRNASTVALRLAQRDLGTDAASEKSSSSGEPLQEILVTAQKRKERLQDVPISVAVVGGDELDRSTSQGVVETLTTVPGVSAVTNRQSGGTAIAIRGAAAAAPIFGGSSPVGYYLDAVPFGFVDSAIGPDVNAFDLEQVEVLRGPQGTLYGASALNGVVRVLTHDAGLNHFEAKARVSGSGTKGGDDNYRADAAVNVPIVEGRFAARLVAGYQNLSGWIDTPTASNINSAESKNFRLKLSAQPTDNLTLGATAWTSRQGYDAPNAADEQQTTIATADQPGKNQTDLYGIRVGYEFPAFSLTSSMGYLNYDGRDTVDFAEVGVPLIARERYQAETFVEELTLNSTAQGPWGWTLGGIYRDGESSTFFTFPGVVGLNWTSKSESYAVYGEVRRRFMNDQMELTLGGRYFHDSVSSRENPDHPPNPFTNYHASNDYDAVTPRVVLSYRPKEDVTLYASYSEGFRSGAPQPYYTTGGVGGLPDTEPDRLHNFEVGLKGDLFDGKLTIDSALYYIRWNDVQELVNVAFPNTPGVAALVNAEAASGFGLDVSVLAHPLPGFDLGVAFSTNDLTSDSDVFSQSTLLYAKGERLAFSPKNTASGLAGYSWALGGGFEAQLFGSVSYTSEQFWRIISPPPASVQRNGRGTDMLVGNLRFSLESPQNWRLTLFADNINNEDGSYFANPNDVNSTNPGTGQRIRPRTLGLQVEYHF
jgi:iron complex outermembrane recepter protein